ncbi:GyrI-like domain-containing protein [Corynebacterium callunae]|uniref:GyrI-like domain-containing protein n=1 Tax=Corynebacterium callunae TaxID=1721 RepID=UPI0031EE51E2
MLDYWHAVATSEPATDFESLAVPAGKGVVFETEGAFPEAIQQMWADAATEWFPANPYLWAKGPQLLKPSIPPTFPLLKQSFGYRLRMWGDCDSHFGLGIHPSVPIYDENMFRHALLRRSARLVNKTPSRP